MSGRTAIALVLVTGATVLAIIDESFRPTFGEIAMLGLGGYLGQLVPRNPQR